MNTLFRYGFSYLISSIWSPRIHVQFCLVFEKRLQNACFLDAFSHFCKRVCPSVGRSVGPSVRWSHTSWSFGKFDILTKMEQNSTGNMKLYYLKDNLKDNLETSTRADRQNSSDVWTPSDSFFLPFFQTLLEPMYLSTYFFIVFVICIKK